METSLNHLPESKRRELRFIADTVSAGLPHVAMIILFGSYARGGWKEAADLAPDRPSGHVSDYDILVLVPDGDEHDEQATAAWHRVREQCRAAGLSAFPNLIRHEIGYVNRKLERGQYFFSDIIAEGRLLHDSGEYTLAEARPLSPAERLRLAGEDFDHWFESAQQFYSLYEMCRAEGWLKKGAFNLHQAAEAAYKTVLLVFTGYIPDEHYLALLGHQVERIDRSFTDVLPRRTAFEEEAVAALEYAYIGARYDRRYQIDEPALTWLAERVADLLGRTERQCRTKLTELASAASPAR